MPMTYPSAAERAAVARKLCGGSHVGSSLRAQYATCLLSTIRMLVLIVPPGAAARAPVNPVSPAAVAAAAERAMTADLGRAVQVHLIKPTLKVPGINPLICFLNCYQFCFKSAFKFNLRRYTSGRSSPPPPPPLPEEKD